MDMLCVRGANKFIEQDIPLRPGMTSKDVFVYMLGDRNPENYVISVSGYNGQNRKIVSLDHKFSSSEVISILPK